MVAAAEPGGWRRERFLLTEETKELASGLNLERWLRAGGSLAAYETSLGKCFWARGAGAPVRTPLRDREGTEKWLKTDLY